MGLAARCPTGVLSPEVAFVLSDDTKKSIASLEMNLAPSLSSVPEQEAEVLRMHGAWGRAAVPCCCKGVFIRAPMVDIV